MMVRATRARQDRSLRFAAFVLSLFLAGALAETGLAQSGDGVWKVYLNGNDVRGLASQGETVFVATSGGFLQYENGRFTQWNRAPLGLASDSLRTVTIAEDGKIWLGTERVGISIFDPEREQFTPFNSLLEPIPGNRIRAVRFQEEGGATRLLVGAEQGYAVFVDGELRFVCQEGVDVCSLPSFDIQDLIYHEGRLWLATAGGVVAQLEDGSWVDVDRGLGGARITAFTILSGELFALSDANVWRWNPVFLAWTAASAGLPTAEGFVPRGFLVAGDALYVAGTTRLSSNAAGVFLYSPVGWTRVGTVAFPATSLTRTAGGRLFAGATDANEIQDGLWELVGNEWTQHKLAGPSARAYYRSLFVDEEDRVWFSTAERNRAPLIGVFDGETWLTRNSGQGNSLRAWTWNLLGVGDLLFLAHCCCPEADLSCRLETFREGTNEFDTVDGIREAWDIAQDARGRIWVSTNNDAEGLSTGLHRYDPSNPGSVLQVTTANSGNPGLTSNQNPAIDVAGNRIWIGSFSEGVDVLNLGPNGNPDVGGGDDVWTHYSTNGADGQRIIGDAIRRLAVAPNGDVWVGTTQGLSIYSGGSFVNIGPRFDRFPTAEVTALAPTRDGGGWVATRGGGLTRMIPNDEGGFEFRNYGPPNLPNPNIEALAVSRDGRTVWAGTSRGLVSFTPIDRTESVATSVLAAYPNPFRPQCHSEVRFEGLGARASGVIVDLAGRVVHRFHSVDPADAIWDGRISGAVAVPGLYVARVNGPRGIESIGIAILDGPCP